MIDVAGSVTIGTILVAVLIIWRKASVLSQEFPYTSDSLAGDSETCPQEFVSRIFSRDDSEFIHATQSKSLRAFFLRERKSVALLWVRQTSARVHQILREHTSAARHSENLHFQTEIGIFLRYVHLRALCGLLFVAIALAGPVWVRNLALRADILFERFTHIRESLHSSAEAANLRTGDSL